MDILTHHQTLDRLFRCWQRELGENYTPYRNHVYRVVNYTRLLASPTAEQLEQVAIAGFFHDVELWLTGAWDYLKPSSQRANNFLVREGKNRWSDAVCLMIREHHKILAYTGEHQELVESFRRADLCDVTLGQIREPIPKAFVKQVTTAFPYAGFHLMLVKTAGKNILKNPMKPLPMFHW